MVRLLGKYPVSPEEGLLDAVGVGVECVCYRGRGGIDRQQHTERLSDWGTRSVSRGGDEDRTHVVLRRRERGVVHGSGSRLHGVAGGGREGHGDVCPTHGGLCDGVRV